MTTARARSLRKRMSPPEVRLWTLLRAEPLAAFHFRRQVPLGPYYADFASHRTKLVIEVDGASHFLDAAIEYDKRRTNFIETQGYRVIRFSTVEILNQLDIVATAIGAHLGLSQ